MENGKRDCTSHQGVSCNGPWERLAWTLRTLGRVNEENETPRSFGSISVPENSDFWIWVVNSSRCTILRRNNVPQAQEFVLPFRFYF